MMRLACPLAALTLTNRVQVWHIIVLADRTRRRRNCVQVSLAGVREEGRELILAQAGSRYKLADHDG